MWKAHFLPPSHYGSHEFQFQLVVEVLPIDLKGYTWAPSLKDKIKLVVLDVLPWVLPEVYFLGQGPMLLVPIPIEEKSKISDFWAEVQPLMSVPAVDY